MSQVTKFIDHYIISLIAISGAVLITVFMIITTHDTLINSEQFLNEIYSMDTCKGMTWDKQWEEKKIWKDDLKLKIITKYMIEKRC